jgi:hypothetical protein
LEPAIEQPVDEARLIRLIDQYEASRREGTYPTFGYMSQYVANPRNVDVIRPLYVQSKLNAFVADCLLEQEMVQLDDEREIRVTRLNRQHPVVLAALGLRATNAAGFVEDPEDEPVDEQADAVLVPCDVEP